MISSQRFRRAVAWVGALLIAAALLLGVFVATGITKSEDTEVLTDFIDHRTPLLTTWMTVATDIFSPIGTILISLAAALLLWILSRSWRNAAYVVLSVGGSALLTYLLKLLFQRQRPPLIDHLVNEVDFSYPSGHATGIASLAFSVAVVITLLSRRFLPAALAWVLAAALVALICVSRLYLGVHWFTDTLAGCCVGTGMTLLLGAFVPETARAKRSRTRTR